MKRKWCNDAEGNLEYLCVHYKQRGKGRMVAYSGLHSLSRYNRILVYHQQTAAYG
jgi:hypothetical protein